MLTSYKNATTNRLKFLIAFIAINRTDIFFFSYYKQQKFDAFEWNLNNLVRKYYRY